MFVKRKFKFAAVILCLCIIMTALSLSGFRESDENKGEEEVFLPIIMYHSILKDSKLWNDYTISPDVFESDLKYFKENGYSTITVSDLINYVYSDKNLPEKCVMLTFDDGYYNNYYYAYPLLKKYEAKAVISPIASMTEKFTETTDISPTYGHISVDDINEMVSSGFVEIQNHSYDMHSLTPRKGISQKKGESDDDYVNAITDDIMKAQNYLREKTGVICSTFVYPFGAESDLTLETVKKLGFVCTLTCTEETNIITKSPESLFELGRFRRDGNESIEKLIKRMSEK